MAASAAVPQWSEYETVIPSAQVSKPARVADAGDSADESRSDVPGDYDFQFYWMSSAGVISDTWETSITAMEASEAPDEYLIHNLFADTFADDISGGVSDIYAYFDPDTRVLSIPSGQPLFTLRNDATGSEIPVGIYGVAMGDRGYVLDAPGDLRLVMVDKGFERASDSPLVGFFIGMRNPDTGRMSGYGCAMFPAMYRFNGVMMYAVSIDDDPTVDPTPAMNDIFTEIVDGKIRVSNFADQGYYATIEFDYDPESSTAAAVDAQLGALSDIEGNPVPYYAAGIAADGGPLMQGDSYVLSADVSSDQRGNAVLTIPAWGMFMGRQTLAVYSSNYIMLFLPLETLGVAAPAVNEDDTDAPARYFDLQGRPVESPAAGSLLIRRRGTKVDKIYVR